MKTRKHTIARVRRGLYNYRAYLIHKGAPGGLGGWIVKNEDDGVYARTRTLRAMKRKIDGWERAEHEASARNEENYRKVC